MEKGLHESLLGESESEAGRMKVQVTQFMRPNGRQVLHELEIDDNCKEKYEEIVECGARLTGEQLRTGEVSQTIETVDGDFEIILTKGSDLAENKKALEKIILRFDKVAFEEWKNGLE